MYTWTTSNSSLATVDSEGQVTTHDGPGVFTVRVAMAKGQQNYDEAKVYILPVTRLEFKSGLQVETATHTPATLSVRMMTHLDKDDDEDVMLTDCADVPFQIVLSDNKNFEVENTFGKRSSLQGHLPSSVSLHNLTKAKARLIRATKISGQQFLVDRGHNPKFDACASFTVRANAPGATSKVTVTYTEPITGRELKASLQMASYRALEVVYPTTDNQNMQPLILLPVGSRTKAVFRGGPSPWVGKPSGHYRNGNRSSKQKPTRFNALFLLSCLQSRSMMKLWSR